MISQAILGIRLVSLLLGSAAVWQLAGNLADSFTAFDPNYWGHYVASEIVRPAIGIGISLALAVFSSRMGRFLAPSE